MNPPLVALHLLVLGHESVKLLDPGIVGGGDGLHSRHLPSGTLDAPPV
ncbi:MAG: hypothetical protein IPK07_26840 [Deltaproteobacteria bacterium]|nr:hypothetical protein [Deltaproteobacteria bacterium]